MRDYPTPEELASADGYLSRCKPHLNRLQRERRARMVRIDYMPSDIALTVIEAKQATLRPGSVEATNSATLNAIVTEWAALTGINCDEVEPPKSPSMEPSCATSTRARKSPAG